MMIRPQTLGLQPSQFGKLFHNAGGFSIPGTAAISETTQKLKPNLQKVFGQLKSEWGTLFQGLKQRFTSKAAFKEGILSGRQAIQQTLQAAKQGGPLKLFKHIGLDFLGIFLAMATSIIPGTSLPLLLISPTCRSFIKGFAGQAAPAAAATLKTVRLTA